MLRVPCTAAMGKGTVSALRIQRLVGTSINCQVTSESPTALSIVSPHINVLPINTARVSSGPTASRNALITNSCSK